MIEWRQTFPKSKQNNQNQNNWKHYSVVFSPSRKTAFKDRFKKKRDKTCTDSILLCQYHLFLFLPFTTVLLSPPLKPTQITKRSQGGATLFSSLFFPWLVRKKFWNLQQPSVCTHRYLRIYIYSRCTAAAAATDKPKEEEERKGRHSIAQLLSDSNRRNRNPTDRPNPMAKAGKDDDDGHQ